MNIRHHLNTVKQLASHVLLGDLERNYLSMVHATGYANPGRQRQSVVPGSAAANYAVNPAPKPAAKQRDGDARGRLLIVANGLEMVLELADMLAMSSRIFVAGNAADADSILAEQDIALVVVAVSTGNPASRELLKCFGDRSHRATPPIIVLSESNDESLTRECVDLGAESYFAGPLDLSVIAPTIEARLKRAVSLAQFRTERHYKDQS